MKIIKQTGIIFTICWLSIIIQQILPFPFPSSVIGLLKVSHIQEKSDFLLSNMAFFFIPAGVGMMNYFDILKENWFSLVVICVLSTLITFAATAFSIRLTIKFINRRK